MSENDELKTEMTANTGSVENDENRDSDFLEEVLACLASSL